MWLPLVTLDRPFGIVVPRGGLPVPGGGTVEIKDVQYLRERNLDNHKVLKSITVTTSLSPVELWAELIDLSWTRIIVVATGSSLYPIYVDSSWISIRVVNGTATATTVFFSGEPAEQRC